MISSEFFNWLTCEASQICFEFQIYEEKDQEATKTNWFSKLLTKWSQRKDIRKWTDDRRYFGTKRKGEEDLKSWRDLRLKWGRKIWQISKKKEQIRRHWNLNWL